MKKKIVSDFMYFFADMGIVAMVGYLFYIIMGRMLGPADYGILMTVIGLYMVISPITSLGFNEALARFVPSLKDKTRAYFIGTLKLTLIISLVVSSLIFLFSDKIALSIYSNINISYPLKIFSLLLITGSLTLVYKGLVQGMRDFKFMLKMDIFSQAVRLIAPAALVYYGFGVVGGLLGWAISFLVLIIIGSLYFRKLKPKKAKMSREFTKFGISSALYATGLWLVIQIPLLYLGLYNIEQAGMFGVALVFGQIFFSFPLIITGVILPHLSEMFAKKKLSKAKRLMHIVLKDSFVLMFPAAITAIFFSRQMIYHIYNQSYLAANEFFLPVILGFLFLGLNTILSVALYSYGKYSDRTLYIWIHVVLKTIMTVVGFIYYGSIGVAYAFLISEIIMLVYVSIMSNRKIGITFPKRLLNSIPAVLIFCILMYIIDEYYIGFEYGILFIGISVVIYLLLLYFFKAFDKDDFELVKLVLKRK